MKKKLLIYSKPLMLRYLMLILQFYIFSGLNALLPGQSVTLTTDKQNYLPGDSVKITGTGWNQNDSVQLTLVHNAPQPVPPHSHLPWFVTPDISGSIQFAWPVTDPEAGTSITLKAFGYQLGIPGNDSSMTNFMIPSITGITVSVSLCAGQPVSVGYTISPEGSFDPGNIFTAELSDGLGSFSSPVSIGTINSVNSGNIDAIIPPGTTEGTLYRIRVVSASPVITSAPDPDDITIRLTPAAPSVGTITQPSCTLTTGSVVLNGLPATGTWTLTRTPGGTTTTGTGTSTTISGLPQGTYTYTVTNEAGCISPSSGNIVINAQPGSPTAPTVGTITQPSCTLATGSVVLNGLPATGTWTLTRTPGGTTTTGTGTSTTISGLPQGTYTFTVTNAAGCISPSSGNIVINAQPGSPTAPTVGTITQPSCTLATGSVVLNGLPATGTWTLTRTPGGTTTTGTGTSTTISGLPQGTYTYTVTNEAGCISPSSGNIVINAQPGSPTAPTVGTITQPSCTLATGSVVLNGLPATGTWTLTRTPGGITTTGTGTSTTISGLPQGTYTFTVTNAAGCISPSSGNIVINAQPGSPTAPTVGTITQPSCTLATGSVVLNGLPATGTWTLTRTPGGTTTTGTGTSTTISGLPQGTYTFTVTNAAGCISPSSGNIVINAQPGTPSAPAVGTITQPSCTLATGTVVLNGLPATGTWTLTRTPGGTTTTGTGTSTTISGLPQGTYTFTVTNAAGCISPSSGNIVINAQPGSSTAPTVGTITQPSCTLATGSVVLNGLPATGTWTLTRTPGGTTTTGTGTSTTILGLPQGTYTFTVTNAAGCISPSSGNIVINAQPGTPTSPVVGTITQPSCTLATGTVVLNGLPPTGTWTLTRTPGGTITIGTGISTTITGLAQGSYTYTVTNAAGCTSPPSGNIIINAQPGTPSAPAVGTITQPSCTLATGTVVLNGLPPTGTWTLTRTPGGIIAIGTGISTTISGLAPGTYTYTVTNAAGCISPSSGNIVINAPPGTPTAPAVGTITQPSCTLATGTVVLNGLPPTGTWTLTRTPGGIITIGTGISTIITGLAQGTYTYTVTNATGCASPPSGNIIINAQPGTPSAPVVGTITQTSCTLATGTVVFNGLPQTGTWTLTRTPGGILTAGTGVSTTITGLPQGAYTYTVTNAAGCTSPSSGNIIINAQPGTPAAPVVGTITQPSCTLATGAVVLNGLPATGTWTLTRTPGGITTTGTGTSTTISGLPQNTYTYTVTNAAGCTSPTSGIIVINAPPSVPAAPVTGSVIQPTCFLITGSVILNGLPATGSWIITQTPGGISTAGNGITATISSISPGTYTYTVTNSMGCTSAPSASVTINPPPIVPAAPVIGGITQPTCVVGTGSVVLISLPTGSWTVIRSPGNIATSSSGTSLTVTGLNPGTYTFTVTNATGCTSQPSPAVIINAQPPFPGVPVYTVDCTPGFNHAIITVTNPIMAGMEYSLDAAAYQASPVFTEIANGNHFIAVRNSGGCVTVGAIFEVLCPCLNPPVILLSANSGSTCGTLPVTVTGNTFGGSATSVTITHNGSGSVTPGSSATSPFSFTYTPVPADRGRNVTITITSDNPLGVPCTAAVVNYTLTVNDNPLPPSIGLITNPTCTSDRGSTVLNDLPPGQWSILIQPGGIVTTGTGTTYTYPGLLPGTYTFEVTDVNGCRSVVSSNAVIPPPPPIPAAPRIGTITHPTCIVSTGSVVLSGLPESGNWILTRMPDMLTRTGAGATFTATAIPSGTYTYTVTNSLGCTSLSSANLVIRDQPPIPQAPSIGNITAPTCTSPTGSVSITGLPANGSWILTRYPGATTTMGSGTNRIVSGITPGTYNFTVTNQFGCISIPTANVVIPLQPPVPSAPVIGTVTQPTYEEPSGSVELEGLPTGSWSLTRTPDTNHVIIEGSGLTHEISGLAGGVYTFTVTNSSRCISRQSEEAVISTLGKPDLFITNPPAVCFPATVDLTLPSVTEGSTGGLRFTYWIDPDTTQELSNPSEATTGTFYIKGTTVSGYFNVQPVTVSVYQRPEAKAGEDQVLVLKYQTNLSAELAEGETGLWSLDKGDGQFADVTDPKTLIDKLATGRNILSWVVTNGICPADTDKVNLLVGDIIVPTLITPNGDTKNEYFIILGLESIGKSELVVFDRRGSVVFRNSDYDNKWNGVDYNENPLPNDTYFYNLTSVNGRSYNGYIVIRR